jgi:hypothetical protein
VNGAYFNYQRAIEKEDENIFPLFCLAPDHSTAYPPINALRPTTPTRAAIEEEKKNDPDLDGSYFMVNHFPLNL